MNSGEAMDFWYNTLYQKRVLTALVGDTDMGCSRE